MSRLRPSSTLSALFNQNLEFSDGSQRRFAKATASLVADEPAADCACPVASSVRAPN